MSDITTGASASARSSASVVGDSAQQTNNKIAETLQDRRAYEAPNTNPRSMREIALARTQMQPRGEAVTAMYARTVEAYGNEQGMPKSQGARSQGANGAQGAQGANKPTQSSGSPNGAAGLDKSSLEKSGFDPSWTPVSLPMLKRIYGDAVAAKSPLSAGKGAEKATAKSASKSSAGGKVKHLSTRKAENKTATAGGKNVRFAGLKSLMSGLGKKLSSLFTSVRSERAAVPRFLQLSDKLKASIKQHEAVQSARHAKMRENLQTRGALDGRTQKFAHVFAQRMEHFDSIAPGFKKETFVTYKQIRKETEALLNESRGKVFTTDDKYNTMVRNLENLNNLFFQDIDMAVLALKTMGK